MKQILKLSAAPAAVLGAAAFFATATPAAATDYCRTEVTAGTRGCGYTSLEQCQTMSSGRGGTCDVNPFPAGGSGDPSSAFAYQPKPGSKNRVKSVGNSSAVSPPCRSRIAILSVHGL